MIFVISDRLEIPSNLKNGRLLTYLLGLDYESERKCRMKHGGFENSQISDHTLGCVRVSFERKKFSSCR